MPWRFGDVVVDPAARTVVRGGQEQPVEPKAFAVLQALLERPGELVERDALLDQVWGHRHVTPGVLTRAIAQVRHALGDDPHQPRYVQTRHAVGYRFIGEFLEDAPDAGEPAPPPAPEPSGPAPPATAAPSAFVERRRPRAARQMVRWPAWAAAAAVLAALLGGLAWWLGRAPVPAEASIAVLPFSTLGSAPEEHYFATGLASELHAALAEEPGLRVAALPPPGTRTADAVTRGRELGVATVLDASVRRSGGRVRINARLSDTRSGYVLWSGTYDRPLADIFAAQVDVARNVVDELGAVLADDGRALERRLAPTRDATAFDAYLRGVAMLGSVRAEQARGPLTQALARDDGFARAQLAICRLELWRFEAHRDAAALPAARSSCRRAARMDGASLEAMLALADLHRLDGQPAQAAALYARAAAAPTMLPRARLGQALLAAGASRPGDARRLLAEAAATGTADPGVLQAVAYQRYLLGDTATAIDTQQQVTRMRPDDGPAWGTLGALLLSAGRNEAAAGALQRSVELEPTEAALSNLGTLHYQAGRHAQAAALYRQATRLNPGNSQIWGNLGDAWLAAGDAVQARGAFAQAALRARAYVALRADDAKALAALGWYEANLGRTAEAGRLLRRAEALGREPGEVAYLNALTLASLGRMDEARVRVGQARGGGVPDSRLASNTVLQAAGLVDATRPPATRIPAPTRATPAPRAAGATTEPTP